MVDPFPYRGTFEHPILSSNVSTGSNHELLLLPIKYVVPDDIDYVLDDQYVVSTNYVFQRILVR